MTSLACYLFCTFDINAVGSANCFIADDNALQLWVCDRWAKRISNWYNVVVEVWLNITDKLTHIVQTVIDGLQQLTQHFLCKKTQQQDVAECCNIKLIAL